MTGGREGRRRQPTRAGGQWLVALLLIVAGCARPSAPATFSQIQEHGSQVATLAVHPYPPVTMRGAELLLTLCDGDGRPIRGAAVLFDLTMPDCQEMPANRPQATEAQEGVYRAPALFTMAGYWQVRVEVAAAGERKEFVFYLRAR